MWFGLAEWLFFLTDKRRLVHRFIDVVCRRQKICLLNITNKKKTNLTRRLQQICGNLNDALLSTFLLQEQHVMLSLAKLCLPF